MTEPTDKKPAPIVLPRRADLTRERKRAALAMVIPPVVPLLQDAQTILGIELRAMVQDARAGTRLDGRGAKKLRDLTVSLQSVQAMNKLAEADTEVGALSDEELAAALEKELTNGE